MNPRAYEPDPSACLSFIGSLTLTQDHILVAGPNGEFRIDGNRDDLAAAHDLIRGLDGHTPLGSLVPDDARRRAEFGTLLGSLGQIGALLDLGEAWRLFHELSSNPPFLPVAHDPMTANELPRLAFGGTTAAADLDGLDPTSLDALAGYRRSADLPATALAPRASLRAAIRLAANAYLPQPDGRRPVASGGGLYPLHFWVIGSADAAAPRQVFAIDHDHGKLGDRGEVSLADLRALFMPDPEVAAVLRRGAAVIVIAADPRRVIRKYGNRGWRFALMECGAVMHQIMLAAAHRKEAVRPVGGFMDAAMRQAICDPALPLLTILVMAQE